MQTKRPPKLVLKSDLNLNHVKSETFFKKSLRFVHLHRTSVPTQDEFIQFWRHNFSDRFIVDMKNDSSSPMATETPLLLTIEQSAKLVGIGRTTAYSLVKSGEWKTIKIGKLRRLTREILETWIQTKIAES